MSRSAIRNLLLPLLREIAGESAQLFLDPCTRVVFWQWRAIRRRLRGKRARFAAWRYRVNRDACLNLADGQCSAFEAADKAVLRLARRNAPLVHELLDAPAHKRREVFELMGPELRRFIAGRG